MPEAVFPGDLNLSALFPPSSYSLVVQRLLIMPKKNEQDQAFEYEWILLLNSFLWLEEEM